MGRDSNEFFVSLNSKIQQLMKSKQSQRKEEL
jgi:hypothetical protein